MEQNIGPYGASNFKMLLYTFHPISAKLYDDIGYHGRIQAITLKSLHHFEILT